MPRKMKQVKAKKSIAETLRRDKNMNGTVSEKLAMYAQLRAIGGFANACAGLGPDGR